MYQLLLHKNKNASLHVTYIGKHQGRCGKVSSMGSNPLFALLRIRASLASVKTSCTAKTKI